MSPVVAMENATQILGSYAITFAVVGGLPARIARADAVEAAV